MVRVPVCPARDGNRFWKVMRIVGTSRTHTVPAAPNVNVSGRVVEVVDEVVVEDGTDVLLVLVVDVDGAVVVVGAAVDVVVPIKVVVVVDVVTSQASGKVVERSTLSAPNV
jgi:hypothetical protein